METISIEALDSITGGTAPAYRRYVNKESGFSVNLLEGGKALIKTPFGDQHQLSIAPLGTRVPRVHMAIDSRPL